MGENQGMPMLRCHNRIPRPMRYAYIIFIMLALASCRTSRSVTSHEMQVESKVEQADTTVTDEIEATVTIETIDSTNTTVHIEETEYDTTVTDENGGHPVKKKKVTDISQGTGTSQVTTNESKTQHAEEGHKSRSKSTHHESEKASEIENEVLPKPTLMLITAIILIIFAPRIRDAGRWLLSLFLNR